MRLLIFTLFALFFTPITVKADAPNSSEIIFKSVPYILQSPKHIKIPENVKNIIAWQYKLSNDKDIYKSEYAEMIKKKNGSDFAAWVLDNMFILINHAEHRLDIAANTGDMDFYASEVRYRKSVDKASLIIREWSKNLIEFESSASKKSVKK